MFDECSLHMFWWRETHFSQPFNPLSWWWRTQEGREPWAFQIFLWQISVFFSNMGINRWQTLWANIDRLETSKFSASMRTRTDCKLARNTRALLYLSVWSIGRLLSQCIIASTLSITYTTIFYMCCSLWNPSQAGINGKLTQLRKCIFPIWWSLQLGPNSALSALHTLAFMNAIGHIGIHFLPFTDGWIVVSKVQGKLLIRII